MKCPQRQHHTARRPVFAPLALVAVLAALCLSALTAGGLPAEVPRKTPATGAAASDAPTTAHYLSTIETRLRQELAAETVTAAEALRRRLIRLSMWGPVAGASRWMLETLGASEAARTVLFPIMPVVRWMSAPFLFPVETGGSADARNREIDRVLAFIAARRAQGLSATLDNVGDASLTPADAAAYRRYYLSLINRFADTGVGEELYLSLKLSALVHDLDAARGDGAAGDARRGDIIAALAELLRAAAAAPHRRIFIRIDMEEYAYKDLTLGLYREVVSQHPVLARAPDGALRLGVVIQAYLRDAARDVTALARWARDNGFRVPIRLVKGAYLEHERDAAKRENRKPPVWDNKPSTDANFEAIAAWMLAHRAWVAPAFGMHNIRTQACVMALAARDGAAADACELQMLYGMGDPIKRVIVGMGYPLREYIPAGSLARGLGYAGRRFQELAGGENALARTMRGEFTGIAGPAPAFVGERDIADGRAVGALLENDAGMPR